MPLFSTKYKTVHILFQLWGIAVLHTKLYCVANTVQLCTCAVCTRVVHVYYVLHTYMNMKLQYECTCDHTYVYTYESYIHEASHMYVAVAVYT